MSLLSIPFKAPAQMRQIFTTYQNTRQLQPMLLRLNIAAIVTTLPSLAKM